MDHFVITVARETGSGGHDITRKLSEKLNIPYYDRDLLRKASEADARDAARRAQADKPGDAPDAKNSGENMEK